MFKKNVQIVTQNASKLRPNSKQSVCQNLKKGLFICIVAANQKNQIFSPNNHVLRQLWKIIRFDVTLPNVLKKLGDCPHYKGILDISK